MKENEKILTQINKITQMGQYGINQVMAKTNQPALRQALKCQRIDYAKIEKEAKNLAANKKMHIKNLSPVAKHMSKVSANMQLTGPNVDSKIAGMMIQGCTRGVIKSLKGVHRCKDPDPAVAKLAQKLLETQHNGVQNMKGFL